MFLYLCDDFCEPCFNSGHIQRLNRENKEILVVIDFPVTCELDSSHLIHFGFCVCVSFKTLYSWCSYNWNYLKSGILPGYNSWIDHGRYHFKKGAVPTVIRVTSPRFSSFILPHCTLVIFYRKFLLNFVGICYTDSQLNIHGIQYINLLINKLLL